MNVEFLQRVKLLILDIDGVLWSGTHPCFGAQEALSNLRAAGKSVRLLTNDAISSRASRLAELTEHGFQLNLDEIYTASYLTAEYLRSLGSPRSMVLLGGEGRDEFVGLPLVERAPEVVVVGDYFDTYERSTLEEAFHAIMNGAKFIAMQRNRYWMDGDQARIDIGFWIAGLEYCTGIQAKLIGKPSAESYQIVLKGAGASAEEAAMVSDDLESDLAGARRASLKTIHVLSTSRSVPPTPAPAADLTVSSLLELSHLLMDWQSHRPQNFR